MALNTPTADQPMTAYGQLLTLCVLHELDPIDHGQEQAMVVLDGFSLCKQHLKSVIDDLSLGLSFDQIIKEAIRESF